MANWRLYIAVMDAFDNRSSAKTIQFLDFAAWMVPENQKVKMGEMEIQKGASRCAQTNIEPLIGIHQSQPAEGYEYETSVSFICY